jgi:hypothetical protein
MARSTVGTHPQSLILEDGLLMTSVTEETCEGEVLTPVISNRISNRNALTLVASTKEEVKNSTEVFTKSCNGYVAAPLDKGSLMEVCSSLDGSSSSEGMSLGRKKRQDDPVLSCGIEDNMFVITCDSVAVDGIFEDLIAAVNEVANVFYLGMPKLSG